MSPLIMDHESPDSSPSPPRQARSASFSISLAKYEDIRRLVDIEFFAFEHEKTNHVLSYRDHNQAAHLQRAIRSYQLLMRKAAALHRQWKAGRTIQQRRAVPDLEAARFRKVVDSDTGLIISWAKTENHAYTVEELASPADVGHEGESQMNRDWFALNERLRRQYMGTRRHCCKFVLAKHGNSRL